MPCAVVKMATESVRAILGKDAGMSRPDERPAGFQKWSAAVSQHIHAVRVVVWAGDGFAPANANFVSTVGAGGSFQLDPQNSH